MSVAPSGTTALADFAANKGTFVQLLRVVGWPSGLAAGQTLVSSRLWALRR